MQQPAAPRSRSLLGLDDLGVLLAVLTLLRLDARRVAREVGRHGLLALFEHDLEVPQHVLLDALARDEGDRIALLAGAARAADAVRVRLDVLRHVVVDHVRHALDVDAAAGDVGRDEDLELATLEAVDGLSGE